MTDQDILKRAGAILHGERLKARCQGERAEAQRLADARRMIERVRSSPWEPLSKSEKIMHAIERLSLEDARLGSVAALTRAYDAEPDPDERENIIRTIVEIVRNEPVIEREKRGGV